MQITLIRKDQKAALVEYLDNGSLKRVIIPAEAVTGNEVDEAILAAGMAYGDPWEDLLDSWRMEQPEAFVESELVKTIANNLRNAGVWTVEDAKSNPRKVVAALQAAYRIDLSTIVSLRKESQNG